MLPANLAKTRAAGRTAYGELPLLYFYIYPRSPHLSLCVFAKHQQKYSFLTFSQMKISRFPCIKILIECSTTAVAYKYKKRIYKVRRICACVIDLHQSTTSKCSSEELANFEFHLVIIHYSFMCLIKQTHNMTDSLFSHISLQVYFYFIKCLLSWFQLRYIIAVVPQRYSTFCESPN